MNNYIFLLLVVVSLGIFGGFAQILDGTLQERHYTWSGVPVVVHSPGTNDLAVGGNKIQNQYYAELPNGYQFVQEISNDGASYSGGSQTKGCIDLDYTQYDAITIKIAYRIEGGGNRYRGSFCYNGITGQDCTPVLNDKAGSVSGVEYVHVFYDEAFGEYRVDGSLGDSFDDLCWSTHAPWATTGNQKTVQKIELLDVSTGTPGIEQPRYGYNNFRSWWERLLAWLKEVFT